MRVSPGDAAGGGAVVWLTGLPGAGKTTLAARLAARLRGAGAPCAVLDGDEVRRALASPAGAGEAERDRFYESLAALATLLARQGLLAVVAATAPRRAHRARARALAPRFVEVHVATPLAECRQRDPKGLYARAGRGEAPNLPGAGAPWEPPETAEVTAAGGEDGAAVEAVVALLGLGSRRVR